MSQRLSDDRTSLWAHRLRRWRIAKLAASSALVLTFFLPNGPATFVEDWPTGFWVSLICTTYHLLWSGGASRWPAYSVAWYWLFAASVVFVPYVFAALLAGQTAGDLGGRSQSQRAVRACRRFVVVMGLVCYAAGEIVARIGLGLQGRLHVLMNDPVDYVWLVVSTGGGLYLLRARHLGDRATPCHDFAGTSIILIWHLALTADGLSTNVAIVASIVLLIALIGEQKETSGRPWRETMRRILLCRLPYEKGVCPKCGYSLRGLRDQRCPECGRPFTFEELGLSPEELGFRTAADA